jgi:hypothetical protein
MSIPSLLIQDQIKVAMNREASTSLGSTSKEPSPSPVSPPQVSDGMAEGSEDTGEKWVWWQGYRKDRRVLGFEAPPGKNVSLVKKPQRRKKREDD